MRRVSSTRSNVEVVREGIVIHHQELLLRARHLCRHRDLAQELVQDTAVRALRFAETFQEGSQVRAWLMRILHNVFISRMRRRSIERRVMDGARVDPNGWAARCTVQDVHPLCTSVERALGSLPAKLQETVRLVDLQELSYREAADAESVPVGTIMSRLHRGRKRLGQQLAC